MANMAKHVNAAMKIVITSTLSKMPGVRGGAVELLAPALALPSFAHDSLNHTRNCSRWRQPQTDCEEQVAQKGERMKEKMAMSIVHSVMVPWNSAT